MPLSPEHHQPKKLSVVEESTEHQQQRQPIESPHSSRASSADSLVDKAFGWEGQKSPQSSKTSSADSEIDEEEIEEVKEKLRTPTSTPNVIEENLLTNEELAQIERIQRLAETMGLVDSKYHDLTASTMSYDEEVKVVEKIPELVEEKSKPPRPPVPSNFDSIDLSTSEIVQKKPPRPPAPSNFDSILTTDEILHIQRVQQMADQMMMVEEESPATSSADSNFESPVEEELKERMIEEVKRRVSEQIDANVVELKGEF